MMPKTKRKRLVVLALLAFFCCGAVVGVDWRHLGGGFLAFLKGKHEPVVAVGGQSSADADATGVGNRGTGPEATGPRLAPASVRRHAQGRVGAGGGHGKPDDEDLFKYGLPAAGGIPAGSFVVAQGEAAASGGPGTPDLPAVLDAGGPAPAGGDVTSPAPGQLSGPTDAGAIGGKAPATPAPAPAPDQPGGSGTDPGDGGTTPVRAPAPVSAVPETSPLAMMGLAALFMALAASRRRRA
jgi:hypothetical protein